MVLDFIVALTVKGRPAAVSHEIKMKNELLHFHAVSSDLIGRERSSPNARARTCVCVSVCVCVCLCVI